LIDSETGQIWLSGPISPNVAPTAVSASSSGSPAATSVPNAIARMINVTGSDVTSAFWKSFLSTSSSNSFSMLALPYASMKKSGCACAASSIAATGASTRSAVSSASPGTS
jgi:hypothetical protein